MAKRPLNLNGVMAKLAWADAQTLLLADIAAATVEGFVQRTPRRIMIPHFTAPDDFAVSAGAIIHAQRSALDLLITDLSLRNGAPKGRQPHFPIRKSQEAFETDKRVKRDLMDLTPREKAIVVGLRPWKGGNDTLFLLHELNLKDKHRELIVAHRHVSEIKIGGHGWLGGIVQWGNTMHVDGSEGIEVTPTVELGITLAEGDTIPLLGAINNFSALVRDIAELFRAEATAQPA